MDINKHNLDKKMSFLWFFEKEIKRLLGLEELFKISVKNKVSLIFLTKLFLDFYRRIV